MRLLDLIHFAAALLRCVNTLQSLVDVPDVSYSALRFTSVLLTVLGPKENGHDTASPPSRSRRDCWSPVGQRTSWK